MKLTNTIRDAFIRAAMDDVPAPVVANVVADFVKAGWPKGKKSVTV